jgi:hypothetical protein
MDAYYIITPAFREKAKEIESKFTPDERRLLAEMAHQFETLMTDKNTNKKD